MKSSPSDVLRLQATAQDQFSQAQVRQMEAAADASVRAGYEALERHRVAQLARIARPGPARIAPQMVAPKSIPPERVDPFLTAIVRRIQRGS
jgi:hypothetical protein